MENKILAYVIMDSDSYTILVLAFIVFFLIFGIPGSKENFTQRRHHHNWRNRYGRRDYYGYYGDYWNIFNPWKINNPCGNYAANKCKGNYYYEPCYESKYFNCMNSTYYA